MLKKLLLTTLALVAVSTAGAKVRHINVDDGLSSRQVYEIEEDPDGFIWIYNNSGVDRYDGTGIRHYTLKPGHAQNDHIQSASTMRTASDGSLWVAVKSGEIYRYDRRLDRFELMYDFTDRDCLLYNFLVLPQGNLVVCTNRGLYSCNPDSGITSMALDGRFVGSVASDGAGGYFAGSDHGVYHLEPDGGVYRSRFIKGTEGVNVHSMIMAGGHLYIGGFSQGILMMDPHTYALSRLPFDIPPLPVNSMTALDSNGLLLGIDGAGVYHINAADGTLIHHYSEGDEPDNALSGNTITDIHVDSQRGLWIATSHNGLNYLPSYTNAVSLLKNRKGEPQSLLSDYVNVIYEDRDGDLWFGTDKGVSRYSPSQQRWWRYLQRGDYVASVVLSIGEDSRGRVLVGTYGDGVSVIDKATGTVTRMPLQEPGSNIGVGTDYVFVSRGTPDGNVWIGGINGPLTRYNPADGSYEYYDVDCVASTVADSTGNLIFAGNKGVGRYDAANDRFTWTTRFDSIQIHYPVRDIAVDSTNTILWVGTAGEGLVRYDSKRNQARRYTMADGLSSNSIYGVTIDRSGSVWVCTETDLYRIDPKDDKLKRLTYYLGTNRGVFNAGALTLSRSGNIMLGSAEGCYVFDPVAEFDYTGDYGGILFTDFLIHDKSVVPGAEGSPLLTNINLTDRIVLERNQNSIEIDFVLIDYANPQRVGFEYMLKGYDQQPHESGASGHARYADLSPGDYTLIVKAIDLYTGRVLDERRIAIEVQPPVWLSTWAKILYVLILIAIGILAWNILRRIRRERRIEAQLQSFATIAHDIRTPMSMVKAPLLSLEHENGLSDTARTNLRQARNGIDKTMAMLADVLNVRRDSQLSRQLRVEPIDLLKFLQVKVEEYSTIAMFKGLTIELAVADGMSKLYVDRDKFDHIVDNLMSNAIKYTPAGKVTIKAAMRGRKHWALSVSDTGIGISKRDARHIFHTRHRSAEAAVCDSAGIGMGLLLTRRLVSDMKGRISFVSDEGRGTTFTVVLPLKYPARYMAKAVGPDVGIPTTDSTDNIADSADSSRSTLFIIEDDSDMLVYLKENLSDDYNIICCDNSAAALEEIHRINPDLVISDVMMPHLRGDELCSMLKTNVDTSHIPVILLTGLAGRSDILKGLEARADDYIVKPFDIVVLRARIRNIIKSRRELRRRMLAEDYEPAQEEFTNELDRRFMTRTMEAIDSHLADSEYSVNELCSDLGMSRTSVYNKIKAISGQSPNEFMRIMRLNRAKELLATRTYNISEVAYMVGFSDPKYFSTCFKKQFGISPSKV